MAKHVYVGEVQRDTFLGTRVSSMSGFRTQQDDLQVIKQALELLKIEAWEIRSDEGAFGTVLEAAPIIKELADAEKKKKEAYNAEMEQLRDKFNKLPMILETYDFGKTKIFIERAEATYNPSWSSKLRASVNTTIQVEGGEKRDFWLSDYLSEDGKVLRKKFQQNYKHYGIPESEIEEIISRLKEIHERVRYYRSEYRLS